MSETIKVDIWSDVQCPWCYIGKRKFEAGVAAFGADVEVEYHSFELAPDTPVDFAGSPVDYLSERKGIPVPQVLEMLERVTGIAESVGLHYDYDSVHQTNTIKAHELLHYAKEALGWSSRPRPGPWHSTEITTPTGHVYVSWAPPLPGPHGAPAVARRGVGWRDARGWSRGAPRRPSRSEKDRATALTDATRE